MDSNGLVNDGFWLGFAKDYVTKAISSRDDAANKLDTFLTAIWVIYTPLLAAGIAFDLISGNVIVRVLMALPVLIVPFARFLCIDVQLPVSVVFYPNEVDSIQFSCYAAVLKSKSRKLQWAIGGTVVAIISIAAALFIYKVTDTSDSFGVNVELNMTNKDAPIIHVYGKIDPGSAYTLTAVGYATTGSTTPISIKTWNNLKSENNGAINVIEAVANTTQKVKVFVEWSYKEKTKVLSSK